MKSLCSNLSGIVSVLNRVMIIFANQNLKTSILRKLIVLSVAFLLIAIASQGQEDKYTPYFAFGVRQGVNYSYVNFSPSVKQGLTFGYTGGLVFKHQNERLFALQIELNFIQKGWTEDLDTIDNSYSRKLNYIELPLITQIVVGKKPNLKVYANLGTSFAYFLSEKEELEVNNELYRREYYEKQVENEFEYSALGELGALFNTGIGQFQLGVRYQFTFTDLFKDNNNVVFVGSQNQLWNLSLTYFFFDNK